MAMGKSSVTMLHSYLKQLCNSQGHLELRQWARAQSQICTRTEDTGALTRSATN